MTETRCPNCGTESAGGVCERCQPDHSQRENFAVTLFTTFLHLREWRIFFRTFFRILRSPTRHTIEIFEEGDSASTLKFFEIAVLLSTLTIFTIFAGGNNFVQEFIFPLYYVAMAVIFIYVLFWLARRKSNIERTTREVFHLYMLQVGFSSLLIFGCLLLAEYAHIFFIFLLPFLTISVFIYSVRIWKYFWRLSTRRTLFYIFNSSVIPGIAVALILFLPFGYNPFFVDPGPIDPGTASSETSSDTQSEAPSESVASGTNGTAGALLSHIPADLQATCQLVASEASPTITAGLVEEQECIPPGSTTPTAVTYLQYEDAESMDAAFNALTVDLTSGSCPSLGVAPYGSEEQQRVGRAACYVATSSENTITWTNEDLNILAFAVSSYLTHEQLTSWWQYAGPN